jgi:predicted RNA polymerase sigma factor
MPEARAAYQKAMSMSQQEPEKGFLKKDWPSCRI